MEHSLHNEYRSINKNKILNKKKNLTDRNGGQAGGDVGGGGQFC